MADFMTLRCMFACLLAAPVLLHAQARPELIDPTRPPPEALQPQSGEPIPTGPVKPRLQSVLVGKGYQGREVAVIDGEIVRRGEKFRGAVLEAVSPKGVVLRRGREKEVLPLFPLAAGSDNTPTAPLKR